MHCQRCRLPISVHRSLSQLNGSQQQLFYNEDLNHKLVTHGNPTDDASFIVLTETLNPLMRTEPNVPRSPAATSMSKETEGIERLFNYIAGKTDLDMPLCQECADSVRQGLKVEYQECCKERDAYITLLNKVKDEPMAGSIEVDDLEKRIGDLEEEVQSALIDLTKAENELKEAQTEHSEAQLEQKKLDEEHSEVYKSRNQLEQQVLSQAVETRRLEALAEYQENQLRRLQATNVYNDVFCVGSEGKFGTINGLRLGRLSDDKVEWSEINAAWGQALLMLSTLVTKLGVKIPEYRLRPLGSMSRIDKLDLHPETGDVVKSTSLDLYSSDYSFERFLYPKRMDAAMTAFLDVLNRVGQHVELSDPTLRLPYAIEGDRIGSVRLSLSSSNETWTAACRYILTNLKWIMAYAITH